MDDKRKFEATELNEHDRKILDKYTKYYSNFIESNTAKADTPKDTQYKSKGMDLS